MRKCCDIYGNAPKYLFPGFMFAFWGTSMGIMSPVPDPAERLLWTKIWVFLRPRILQTQVGG